MVRLRFVIATEEDNKKELLMTLFERLVLLKPHCRLRFEISSEDTLTRTESSELKLKTLSITGGVLSVLLIITDNLLVSMR